MNQDESVVNSFFPKWNWQAKEDDLRDHPDHHDAELLLRLYDLRREEKLRRAREWFFREFRPESVDDYLQRYPAGTEENSFFRMVIGYWDMAASIVNHGLINHELFFENTTEFWVVWSRAQKIAAGLRQRRKNPHIWGSLETLAVEYEKWMNGRAPEALEVLREQLVNAPAKK